MQMDNLLNVLTLTATQVAQYRTVSGLYAEFCTTAQSRSTLLELSRTTLKGSVVGQEDLPNLSLLLTPASSDINTAHFKAVTAKMQTPTAKRYLRHLKGEISTALHQTLIAFAKMERAIGDDPDLKSAFLRDMTTLRTLFDTLPENHEFIFTHFTEILERHSHSSTPSLTAVNELGTFFNVRYDRPVTDWTLEHPDQMQANPFLCKYRWYLFREMLLHWWGKLSHLFNAT